MKLEKINSQDLLRVLIERKYLALVADNTYRIAPDAFITKEN